MADYLVSAGDRGAAQKGPASTVPVIVDSVKRNEQFPIVRCSYLSVECETPSEDWALKIGSRKMPFLMLGLDGIITGPFGAKRFKNVDQIEDLFVAIEDVAGLLIDIDDIWLPLSLFERYSRPREGNVYRLDGSLFALAFAFREGRIDTEFFLNNCRDMDHPLFFSRKETRVFRQWHTLQIQGASEQYPKNRSLALEYPE
jgi:hypothetical protein